MLKKRDLLWLLVYPIYQIIGTFRHEGSHALIALIQSAKVTEFVFWPSYTEHGFHWGYVRYQGETDWFFSAAPYLFDLLTFIIFFCVCTWVLFTKRWIWLNLVIIGMLSPFVNSLYNYWGEGSTYNDVWILFEDLPGMVVRGYFVVTLILYLLGIVSVFRYSKTTQFHRTQKRSMMRGDM